METVIKLTGINKIYRTDEVETQALENVNLEVQGASSSASWVPQAAASQRC